MYLSFPVIKQILFISRYDTYRQSSYKILRQKKNNNVSKINQLDNTSHSTCCCCLILKKKSMMMISWVDVRVQYWLFYINLLLLVNRCLSMVLKCEQDDELRCYNNYITKRRVSLLTSFHNKRTNIVQSCFLRNFSNFCMFHKLLS